MEITTKMKILVLNGSPKNGRSNTLNITKAFLAGFPEDSEIEYVSLYKLNIKPCVGLLFLLEQNAG